MSRFISTTLGGYNICLLLLNNDWTDDVTVSHQFRASVASGMTTVESRRPRATALLHTVTCTYTLTKTDADDFRQLLPALTTQLIALPMPSDVDLAGPSSGFIYNQSQYWANFDPIGGGYQILPLSSVVSPAGGLFTQPLMAPILFGRLKERPQAKIIDSQTIQLKLTVQEESPWAFRMGVSFTSPTWTALPDWINEPTETSDLQTTHKQLGQSREAVLEFQDAASQWLQQGGFTFIGKLQIQQHLAFFLQQQGEVKSWGSFPAWCTPGLNTSTDPSTMTVRFSSDKLDLNYKGVNGWAAQADVGFIQELTASLAQSQDPLAMVARVTLQCSPHTSNYVEWYADWDCPLTVGSETYNPWPMSLKAMKRDLELQNDTIAVQFAYSQSILFGWWVREWVDFPVLIELFFVDPNNLSAGLKPFYSATVQSVVPKGTTVTVNAALVGGALKRNAFNWYFSTSCNANLGDQNCGVNLLALQTQGTWTPSTGLSADGMTMTLTGASGWTGFGTPASWTPGMFAYGYLVITGLASGGGSVSGVVAGTVPIMRQITNSSSSGTTLTLTLAKPITTDRLPISASYGVACVPGCSKQNGFYDPATITNPTPTAIATPPPCTCAFFGNYNNVGAFPFAPPYVSQAVLANPRMGK